MHGSALQKLRIIYDYTIDEMSEKLKIQKESLLGIECGKEYPADDMLKKYAKIFGLSVKSLKLILKNFEDAKKRHIYEKFAKDCVLKLIDAFSGKEKRAD